MNKYNIFGYPGPKGDSAYRVAVKNGFVGSEEDWLASLEGAVGPQGPAADANVISQSFASLNHTHGNIYTASISGSDLTNSFASSGITLGIPKWLTTAATGGAAGDWTTATKTGSDIQISTGATNTLYYANFLTTAATGGAGGGDWATSSITGSGISIVTGAATNTLQYGAFLTTAQSPGEYLTTAAQSVHTHDYQSTGNYLTTAAVSNHTHSDLYQSTGAYLTTAANSTHVHNLNEIDALTDDKTFFMNTRQLQFQWGTNMTTFTTAVNRQGLFEIDIAGGTNFATNSTYHAEGLHIHQSVNNPYIHLVHIEADGTNAIPLHIEASGSIGVEINTPIKYDGGSVPMILGTSQSNSVANLNVNYLQNKVSSDFAASGHTHSDLYIAKGDSTAYQTATLASTFAQTANVMLTGERANYYYTSNNTLANSTHDHGAFSISATSNSTETVIRVSSNSSGFTFVQPSFLTTAAGSGHTHSDLYLPVGNSTQWATGTLSSALMPLSYSSGFQTATLATKFLTTAAAEGHTHGAGATASTAGSDLIVTTASNSWQFGVPKWLTTAAPTGHTHSDLYLPVGNSTQWATGTLSSALMPLSYSSGFQTGTLSSALMPLSYSSGFQTATLATKFLTTAAAADHTHGAGSTASTAGVDLKFSTASNGWTLGVPAWITTGGAGGGIAASLSGNSTSAGGGYSNITSGTMILAGGDNITLSQNASRITIIGASANGPASIYFADGNGISWGSSSNGSSTTISASSYVGSGVNVAGSDASTVTNGVVQFANANNVSFGLNGSTMTASVQDGRLGFYEPYVQTNTTGLVPGQSSWYFAPFVVPGGISGGRINFLISNTSTAGIMMDITAAYASNSIGGKNQSYTQLISAALYSQGAGANSTRLESFWGNTWSYGITHKLSVNIGAANSVLAYNSCSISYVNDIGSNGATSASQFASASSSNATNTSLASDALKSVGVSIRNMLSNQLKVPVAFNTSISEGNYWLGVMHYTTHNTATSGASFPGASALMMSNINLLGIQRAAVASYRGFGNTASNASDNAFFGAGVVYTVQSAAAPQYVTTGDIKTIANGVIPYFNFERRGLTN
jgi:hypothetical protein